MKQTERQLRERKRERETEMFAKEEIAIPPTALGQTIVRPQEHQLKYRPELAQCLSNPSGRRIFRQYLDESLATENLQFWEEVEVYRAARGGVEPATKILQNYVLPDAPYSINIDFNVQQDTITEAKKGTPSAFDIAQYEIYRLLADDRWEKFKQTPHFLRYRSTTRSGASLLKIIINLLILFAIVFAVYFLIKDK